MKTTIQRSEDRGVAEFGWLHSRHSFSFGDYYNPEKMGFGLLRVLNDDIVEAGQGFGTHPHNNMEIISIVLKGELAHKDSMGTGSVIKENEVQVMSAGTGVTHSEYNPLQTEKINFLQLWIFPQKRNVKPRYAQKLFPAEERVNRLQTVVSGDESDGSLYIYQDASLLRGSLEKGKTLTYTPKDQNRGVYIFLIEGSVGIDNNELYRRDSIGIEGAEDIKITSQMDSDILVIDVPMDNSGF
ncbi:MAG: pirin family protein [Ignavibacteriales bacterium]